MIFCLVGTNPYDFSRLVRKLDEIALELKIPVVIQTGNTLYKPKNCESFAFKSKEEVQELLKNADLVITQGGYGSMTDAIMMHKKLIAVPRLQEMNEAQDNQSELVTYFETKGYLKACYETDGLEEMIQNLLSSDNTFKPYERETEVKVNKLIKDFLDEL